MKKLKARIKCILLTGHRMEKYQIKMVDGMFGRIEAQKTKCIDCQYVQEYWVAKEKYRQPVRYY